VGDARREIGPPPPDHFIPDDWKERIVLQVSQETVVVFPLPQVGVGGVLLAGLP
jgi:hypothetical protein